MQPKQLSFLLPDSPTQIREVIQAYAMPIKDLPISEQPINRLLHVGPAALATIELLAIITSTGYFTHAEHLFKTFDGIPGLARATTNELLAIDGVGPSTVARLKAAFELGRRLLVTHPAERPQVRSPADAAQLLMAEMSLLDQEHLRVVLLDTKNYVHAIPTVYIGSLNTSLIRISEVLRPAITTNSAAIIVVHNHPSGDPTPSPEDVIVTSRIKDGASLIDIELLDHLIIGGNRFISLKERGLGFN